MVTIDELEKQVNEVLNGKSAEDLSKVITQLQNLADTQEKPVRTRALNLLGKIATQSGSSMVKFDRELDEIIQKAEYAFYSAKFDVAVKYYEQALKIRPDYQGAKENLRAAKKYIKSGRIPVELLPIEIANLYHQAQFAIKNERYFEALDLIENALGIAQKLEIYSFWREGIEFEATAKQYVSALQELESLKKLASEDLQEAYDFLSRFPERFSIFKRQDYVEKVKDDYFAWKRLQDFTANMQLRFGEISSESIIKEANQAEYLRQQYSKNQRIAEAIEQVKDFLARTQKLEGIIQTAKTHMSAAKYNDALLSLDAVKELSPLTIKEVENLKRIAQTNLAGQQKYYELMGRGHKHLEVEDFETAMAAFLEANELIHGSRSVLLPDVDAPKYLIKEGGANG